MNAYPFTVIHGRADLAACTETHAAWQRSVDREKASRALFREAVAEAREGGAKLADIAAELGVTRQAVQKVLREVRREEDERELAGAMLERQVNGMIREERAGLGRVNCGSCGAFKSRPHSVCSQCGDDPVTHAGSVHEYDEAIYGRRVL